MSKPYQSKQSLGLKRAAAPPFPSNVGADNVPQMLRASGMENSLRSLNDAPPHSTAGKAVESFPPAASSSLLGRIDGASSFRNGKRSTCDSVHEGNQLLEQGVDIAGCSGSDIRPEQNEKSKSATSHPKFPSAFPPPLPNEPSKVAPMRSKYGSKSLQDSAATTPGNVGLPYVSPSQIDVEYLGSRSANGTPSETNRVGQDAVQSHRGLSEGSLPSSLPANSLQSAKLADKESAMAMQPHFRVDMTPLVTAQAPAASSGKIHRPRANGGYLRLSQHLGDVPKKSSTRDAASKNTTAHSKEAETAMSSANNSTHTTEPYPTIPKEATPYRASQAEETPSVEPTTTGKTTTHARPKPLGTFGELRLSKIAEDQPLEFTTFEPMHTRNADINHSFHSSFASTAPPSEGGNSPRSATPSAGPAGHSSERVGAHVRAMLSSDFPDPARLIDFLDLPEERQVSELTNALMRQYWMRNIIPALQNSAESAGRDSDIAPEKGILSSTTNSSYVTGGNTIHKERVKGLCKKLFPCVGGSLKDHSAVCFLIDLSSACEADSAENALKAFTDGTHSPSILHSTNGNAADNAETSPNIRMLETMSNERHLTVLEAVSQSVTARNVELLRQEYDGEDRAETKPSVSPKRTDSSRIHKRLSDAMNDISVEAMLAVEESVHQFLYQRDYSVEKCSPEVVQGLVKQHVGLLSSRLSVCVEQLDLQEVWKQASDAQSTLASTTSSKAAAAAHRGGGMSSDDTLVDFTSPRRDMHASEWHTSDPPAALSCGSRSIRTCDSPAENLDPSLPKEPSEVPTDSKGTPSLAKMDIAALQETQSRNEGAFNSEESVLNKKEIVRMLDASINAAAALNEAYPPRRFPVAPDSTLAYIFGVEGAFFTQKRDTEQLNQLTNSMRSQAQAMSMSRHQSQTATPLPGFKRDDPFEAKRSRTSTHHRIRELDQYSTPTSTSPSGLTPRVTPTMGEVPIVNSNTGPAVLQLIPGRPPHRTSRRKSKGRDSINMSPVLKFVGCNQFGNDAEEATGQTFESLPPPHVSGRGHSKVSPTTAQAATLSPRDLADTQLSEMSEDQTQAQCYSPLIDSVLGNTQNTFSISEGTSPSHSASASPQRRGYTSGRDAAYTVPPTQQMQQQQQFHGQVVSPVLARSKGQSAAHNSLSQKRSSKMFSVCQMDDNHDAPEGIKKSDSSTSVENMQTPSAGKVGIPTYVPAPPHLDEHSMSTKSIPSSIHPLLKRLQSQSSRQHSLSPPSSSMTQMATSTATSCETGPAMNGSGSQYAGRHSNKGRLYSHGEGRCSSGAVDSVDTLRSETEAQESTMSPLSFHHRDLTHASNSMSFSTLTSTNVDDVQDFSASVEKCLSLFSVRAKHQSIIEMHLKRVISNIQNIRDELVQCAQSVQSANGFGCAYTAFSTPGCQLNQLLSVTSRQTSSRLDTGSAMVSDLLQSPSSHNWFISGDRGTSPHRASGQTGGKNSLLDPRTRSPALRSPFTTTPPMPTPSTNSFQRSVNFSAPDLGPLEQTDASEDAVGSHVLSRPLGILPSAASSAVNAASLRGADRPKQKTASSRLSPQAAAVEAAIALRSSESALEGSSGKRSGSPASALPDVVKSSTTSWRASKDSNDLVSIIDSHASKGGEGCESQGASIRDLPPRTSSIPTSVLSTCISTDTYGLDTSAQTLTNTRSSLTPLRTTKSPATEKINVTLGGNALPSLHERTTSRHSTASKESRALIQSFTSSTHEEGHNEPKVQDACTTNSSFNFSDTGASAPLSQREVVVHAAAEEPQSIADRCAGSQFSTPLIRSTLRESSDLGLEREIPRALRSTSHPTNDVLKTDGDERSVVPEMEYNLPPPPPPQPQIESLDDLDMLSKEMLGEGSCGRVFAVYRRDTDTTVAVKEIDLCESSIAQVKNEVNVLWGALKDEDSSSNVQMVTLERAGYSISVNELRKSLVSCYGIFHNSGTVSIVLEAMTGGSIKDLLRRRKESPPEPGLKQTGMTEEECCAVAYQTLRGLLYLHEVRHQLHRDIKPHNVLFDNRTGYVKLTDFGISSRPMQSMGFNEHDTYCGTTAYMSPSRLGGDSTYCDESDLWALGISLLEMAHGSLPFKPGVFVIEAFKKKPPRLPGYTEAMRSKNSSGGVVKPRKSSSSVTYSNEFHDFIALSLPAKPDESDNDADNSGLRSEATSYLSPGGVQSRVTRSSFVDAISTAFSPTATRMSPSCGPDTSVRNSNAAPFPNPADSTMTVGRDVGVSNRQTDQSNEDGDSEDGDDTEASYVSSIAGGTSGTMSIAVTLPAEAQMSTPTDIDKWNDRPPLRDRTVPMESSGPAGRIEPHAPTSPLVLKHPSPSQRRPHSSCGVALSQRRIRTPSPFTTPNALPQPQPLAQFTTKRFFTPKQTAGSSVDGTQRLAASAGWESDHDLHTTQSVGKPSLLPSVSTAPSEGSGATRRMFTTVNTSGSALAPRPNPLGHEKSNSMFSESSVYGANSSLPCFSTEGNTVAYPYTAPPAPPLRLPSTEINPNGFRSSISVEPKLDSTHGWTKSDVSQPTAEASGVPNPGTGKSTNGATAPSTNPKTDTSLHDEPLSAALLLSHPWFRNMTMQRSRWIVAQMSPSTFISDDDDDDDDA